MIKNYFIIAIRNLWNRKIYSGITLLGFSIACAFCMLIYLYMQQERSFDAFHRNAQRLYRLELNSNAFGGYEESKNNGFFSFLTGREQTEINTLSHPLVFGDDLKNNFPEIETVIRYQGAYAPAVRLNNQSYPMEGQRTVFMEKNFFTVFDFPLKYGESSTVLNDPGGVVINERTAKRFFGNENPVGKTLTIPTASERIFTIAGVAKDFPVNSSMNYDIVLPLEAHPSYVENSADRSNQHFNHVTLVLFKKTTDVSSFKKKLETFANGYYATPIKEWQTRSEKPVNFNLILRPFARAHYNPSKSWGHYTNLANLYQLAFLAIIIMLIACVNYILLTLTNTISRSQEVGIRKSMGASRKHIVWQFLVETEVLVILSFFAGLVLCVTAIPFFNSVTGANIDLSVFSLQDFIGAAAALFLMLGILAGFYPAFIMSGIRPLNMLRKFSSVKLSPVLSKGLVVIQYTACLVFIISSVFISKQMKYINRMNLGFDKEQVITLENPYDYDDPQRKALQQQVTQFTSADPAIAKTTFSNSRFAWGFNQNGHLINDKREMIYQFVVDFNYFDFMGVPVIKGRSFSSDMPADSARLTIPESMIVPDASSVKQAIVVNETLYTMLGQPPVGELNRPMGARIIGVCRDYQFWDATQKIPPAYHMIGGKRNGFSFAYLKIRAGQDIPGVIERVRANWNRVTSNQLFTFSFMDDQVRKGYESYTQWLKIVNAATFLAVIIACLGLFGLSGLFAVNRTKEIGIRKVMGASLSSIFFLLNRDVIKMIFIAFVIALPASIYFMNGWLQNFANRIDLHWLSFVLAGGIGLMLAVIAVSYHSIKAANANPVESLRTE
jgi:putative ABC transport system permease protein